jgi:hypothetical protein
LTIGPLINLASAEKVPLATNRLAALPKFDGWYVYTT